MSQKKIEDKFMSENNKYKSDDIFLNTIPKHLEPLKKKKKEENAI